MKNYELCQARTWPAQASFTKPGSRSRSRRHSHSHSHTQELHLNFISSFPQTAAVLLRNYMYTSKIKWLPCLNRLII